MEENATTALTVLTHMITPAVLISASGTLILSTSQRLSRVVSRVRELSSRFEALTQKQDELSPLDERRVVVIWDQLERQRRRAKLLLRALTNFYISVGAFIATSFCVGFTALLGMTFGWLSVGLGLSGASFLMYGSVLLMKEARQAVNTIYREMDFLLEVCRLSSSKDLFERLTVSQSKDLKE